MEDRPYIINKTAARVLSDGKIPDSKLNIPYFDVPGKVIGCC